MSVLKLQNYNEGDREREDGGGERRKKGRKEGRKKNKVTFKEYSMGAC